MNPAKNKETLTKYLRGRTAVLRGARILAYLQDMSRLLRSVRLALHPARRLNQRFPNFTWLLCLLLMAYTTNSLAERADRSKPLHLEANSVFVDDANQLSTFDGSVELTQGTLLIQADRIVVTQDKEGFQHCTANGHLAHFRQKREGVNEYVEAYGERIEYDTRSEIVEFFGHARIRREGDDVSGEHIVYNTRTEVFQVEGAPQDQSKTTPSGGRVTVVIQPKSSPSEANPASAPQPVFSPTPSIQSRPPHE